MTREPRYDAAQAEIIRSYQDQLAALERRCADCETRHAALIAELAAREAAALD